MAENGRFAKLSCEQVPSQNGTDAGAIDIKFKQLVAHPKNIGTTQTVEGVLHPNGAIEGEITEVDTGKTILHARSDGTGLVAVPTAGKQEPLSEIATRALNEPAQACKRMLNLAPG